MLVGDPPHALVQDEITALLVQGARGEPTTSLVLCECGAPGTAATPDVRAAVARLCALLPTQYDAG